MQQGCFPRGSLCGPAPLTVLPPHLTPTRLGATSRFSGYTHRLLPAPQLTGAGEGLPSSRAHLPAIPLPLPRGVPRRLHVQVFGAFRGLRRESSGSAPPCPRLGLASRGCRIRFMLRAGSSLPPKGPLTLRFDARRFPLTPAACYRASWRLPGLDSHQLADTSFCGSYLSFHPSFLRCPRLWARGRTTSRCPPRSTEGGPSRTPLHASARLVGLRTPHPRSRCRRRRVLPPPGATCPSAAAGTSSSRWRQRCGPSTGAIRLKRGPYWR